MIKTINRTGLLYLSLFVMFCTSCKKSKEKSAIKISFYNVPLSCNAADLGCGSLAKPVLLELDNANIVDTASLNYEGTVVALKWEGNPAENEKSRVINNVNNKFGINISQIRGSFQDSLSTNYLKNRTNWYNVSRIDELSEKEASVIAEKIVFQIRNYISADKPILDSLQKGMQHSIADEFINSKYRNPWKKYTKREIKEIEKELSISLQKVGDKYLGKGKMPDIVVRLPKRYYK